MKIKESIALVQEKRSRDGPLPIEVAPYTCSDFFKVQKRGTKPKAVRWDHRLSLESRNLRTSPLKAASRANQGDIISLGTARPTPEYYPWDVLTMQCRSTAASSGNEQQQSSSMSCLDGESGYDLGIAMNYGYSTGSPQVLRYVTEHIEMVHDPPYDDWESCLTCGSTSALDITLRILCNRGDAVLVEKYTYSGTLGTIHAQGLHTVGIEMDQFGLLPEDLDQQLDTWDSDKGPKPFVLYMIPTGQNPTGATQNLTRRKEIYRIAVKHDLYILEDDPYYFLNMERAGYNGTTPQSLTLDPDDYLQHLPTSYLSLDTSGRVLRIDTTSKILAPGLRCGWITGCSQIVNKFVSYSEVGIAAPAGPSQVMLYKLLDETWGHEGFIKWLNSLSEEYRQRRDMMIEACMNSLPLEVCHWETPAAGMFIWVVVKATKHPEFGQHINGELSQKTLLHIEGEIFKKCQENGVLVSKGSWFRPEGQELQDLCFRLTFAASSKDVLSQGITRFGKALRSEFAM
ncbi:hypothetical protein JX265_011486 [Neoarthrinium moseri]|uniref:Aminotransferase class I/classII large domain-containing protein n=1 Tax=Neoarthrinium moseri TaxID=1658444 RepID=A0A9Q0AKL2_9PEZI|nr:hypothetical protein JX266_005522 [Neoarthrinium moseri]KAI1856527.1 hypothetical protein JX265_011486 [Neoarthrinium moseri]